MQSIVWMYKIYQICLKLQQLNYYRPEKQIDFPSFFLKVEFVTFRMVKNKINIIISFAQFTSDWLVLSKNFSHFDNIE